MTVRRSARLFALGALAGAFVACARALPPPGGEEDRTPPQIVGVTPEPLSVVPDFDGEVVFRFDERISERGVDNVVLITPETGEVRISRGRSEIRARVEGGWKPAVIYRVVLLPGVRDLFGNERRTPAELVFSTGPAIPPTAIAGLVTDRITGRPAAQAIVEATRRTDSLRYVTSADSQSFFVLQNLPYGFYDVLAYVDQNRNRRRDASEARSALVPVPLNERSDTMPIDLVVIPPDTTPARLIRAEARDSTEIHIFTDDWLEPAVPLASLQIRILTLPDSTPVEGAHRAMTVDSFTVHKARADSIARADSMARADSIARADSAARAARGDTARADTTRPPARRGGGPVIRRPPPRVPARQAPGSELPPIGPLPYQELVIVPAAPLAPGRYVIEVRGLQNIAQRPGGGGMQAFEVRRPEPPDTTDTTRQALARPRRSARSTAGVALRILPRS